MCLALYLFTNSRVPESSWEEANPGVFVQAVNNCEDRNALKWPHEEENVYYVGGYQGCGCGWSVVSEWDDSSDRAAKARDRLSLGRILRTVGLKGSWFVVCWEGDQGEPMHPVQLVTIDQIEDPGFEFTELQPYRLALPGAAER